MLIRKSVTKPVRTGLRTEELWLGPDHGVIAAWERGREMSGETTPESESLTARARNGELILLPWKGGVERVLKNTLKYGTFRYLAMWQGLRGDDLDIDLARETQRVCTATGMTVVYTSDAKKFAVTE